MAIPYVHRTGVTWSTEKSFDPPLFKNLFLNLPLSIRELLALRVRERSRHKQYGKKWIDVSPHAVHKTLDDYHLLHLIHGHTHEFATHSIPPKPKKYPINPLHKERIVLGDWSDKAGSFVFINLKGHAKLHPYQIPS